MKWQWPFVWRSDYNAVRLENYTLRDALRNSNAELHKHRRLLAQLRAGEQTATEAVERALQR